MPLRSFFKWLTRQNVILSNPASELVLPRLERRLPRHVLSAAEAEQVLAEPDTAAPLGLRDRAMLETLYSTGMRRMELLGLSVLDLDAERGTVHHPPRQGAQGSHGAHRRAGAGAGLRATSTRSRPELVVPPDERHASLSSLGEALSPNQVTHLVRRYVAGAELGKQRRLPPLPPHRRHADA